MREIGFARLMNIFLQFHYCRAIWKGVEYEPIQISHDTFGFLMILRPSSQAGVE